MEFTEAENLIIKYLNNQASHEEMERLSDWLEIPENEAVFNDYVKTNHAIDYNLKKFDSEGVKQKLIHKIRRNKSVFYTRRKQSFLKYAAIIVISLGIGYFYQQGFFSSQPENVLSPKEESITLELENGQIKIIDPTSAKKITNAQGKVVGNQNKTQLTYSEGLAETLIYNTLNVPYGKRFELILSDGTAVYLNAGTSMKYPVKFLEGEERQVFLTGEAFFEVAKDSQRPFIVNAEELKIKVLGTEFNVSSYPENKAIDVVLVEGLVGLYTKAGNFNPENNTILKPGFLAAYNKAQSTIETKKVVTEVYTSWIDGELIFKNMSFENILKRLERHYNITIINKNTALAKEKFNAAFSDEPIEKILFYLHETYGIDFTIEDNKVIIKK